MTSIALQGPHDATARTVVSAITYLPFGPVSQMVYGKDRLSLSRRYDGNYRGTAIDGLGLHLKVKRDPNGNIVAVRTRKHQHLPTERYRYDALQRLTAVTGSWGYLKQHYRYNATGDRLSKITATDGVVRYRYQPGSHKLAAIGQGFGWGASWQSGDLFCGWPFHHTCHRHDGTVLTDANGNQIRMPRQGKELNFTYGANNRLTQIATTQGARATYLYDGRGLRVEKLTTNSVQARDFLYQSTHLVSESVSGSGHQRDYVWLDHTLVASVDTAPQGTQIHYVATDFLGTPRRVTDTRGNPIWSWSYAGNPFGERKAHGNYRFNLRFPGQYQDAVSGLNYNVHRDYDATNGRYVESDPKGLFGGYSTYAYTKSSPFTGSDPLGLIRWKGSVGGISGPVFETLEFSLTSECTNGHQVDVTIKAIAFGLGIGPPAGVSSSSVEFEDGRSRFSDPDPYVFVGSFSTSSTGYSLGYDALNYTTYHLGSARSLNNLSHGNNDWVNFSIGISGMPVGRSWYVSSNSWGCQCESQ